MKTMVYIGCSAFNNAYWKGIFYPENLPRTKWFDFYARYFSTYELNGTFYRMPTVKSLQSWYEKVPGDFVFSVKAPKTITHFKKLIGCEDELAAFYAICREGLDDKLGQVLFQLPPSFSYSAERLGLIVNLIDHSFRNVIEFRHESWWIPEVYETLKRAGIAFCNPSYPKLPETLIATTETGYIRLHGKPKLFYSGYGEAELQKLHCDIHKAGWKEAFVYFNNTADVHGIMNARYFLKLEN